MTERTGASQAVLFTCRTYLRLPRLTSHGRKTQNGRTMYRAPSVFFALYQVYSGPPAPHPRCINCSRAASQYSIKGFWVRRKKSDVVFFLCFPQFGFSCNILFLDCYADFFFFVCLFVCEKKVRPQRTKLPIFLESLNATSKIRL